MVTEELLNMAVPRIKPIAFTGGGGIHVQAQTSVCDSLEHMNQTWAENKIQEHFLLQAARPG